MKLTDKINEDLKTAMKSRDQVALRGIRAIKAALLLVQTDGSGKSLDSSGEIALLQKLVKQRRDSLTIYEQQGRDDLATIEREEIEVISKYLPAQVGEKELKSLVQSIIQELGADSMKDMGRVMGVASRKLAGRAEGRLIAAAVKEILSS